MDLISFLEERLQKPLPGEEAQIRMAHAFRRKLWPAPPSAVQAGVLALFYPVEEDWNMVFIERTSRHSNDKHSGQISFPGGKLESTDADIIQCALREAEEEVGVDATQIKVLGQLTSLYIPVSNFLVHPVIGVCENEIQFTPDPGEVQDILELPFRHFLEESNIRHMDMIFGAGMKMKDVPYFDAHGKVIWGATAMIISEMVTMVEETKGYLARI